ncbi:MAG: hypothetical protein IT373_37565, partial [Polyangiaceae bacterium]|nr:hypothetical protein [Polyangiaceae bacterium]
LAKAVKAPPRIERRGIGFSRILADGKPGPRTTTFHAREGDLNGVPIDFRFPRFPEVTVGSSASDHAAVFFDVG